MDDHTFSTVVTVVRRVMSSAAVALAMAALAALPGAAAAAGAARVAALGRVATGIAIWLAAATFPSAAEEVDEQTAAAAADGQHNHYDEDDGPQGKARGRSAERLVQRLWGLVIFAVFVHFRCFDKNCHSFPLKLFSINCIVLIAFRTNGIHTANECIVKVFAKFSFF